MKITEATNGTGAAIIFYSTSDGADTVTDSCCQFDNLVNKNPRASYTLTPRQDGSYALFLRMGDLGVGQKQSLVWYYGAGQANQITTIINQVGQSSGAIPAAPVKAPEVPKQNAIAVAQATASTAPNPNTTTANPTVWHPTLPVSVNAAPSQGSVRTNLSVGSMDVVQLSSRDMAKVENNGGTDNGTATPSGAGQTSANANLMGPTKVFVVDGGVRMPADTSKESGSAKTDDKK